MIRVTPRRAAFGHRSSRRWAVPFVRGLASVHRLLPLLILSLGCNKLFAKDTPAPAAEEAKADAEKTPPEAAHAEAAGEPPRDARAARYGVPFAWETSPEEPLARARKFMAEVLAANTAFMAQGRDHFAPFAEGERPRATVLACADSRVQAGAWDASAENDDYTVRNLGNQLETSLGSVEYGVEHLHTPVLLIIGHTGCDAVETVMNKAVKGKDAISQELSHMKLSERRRGGDSGEWDALTSAVVANVDSQVSQAVAHFSPFVQSGELTVVGAVYDVANHFAEGHGRLRIVNVNSNVEDARIAAFVEAVKEDEKPARVPSFVARRAPDERALLDGSSRLPPGTPRATINAVSVLGSGGLDAVSSGTVRTPRAVGGILPGTSDLKLAPGANRYANVGRSPAAVGASAVPGHGAPAAPGPAGHSPPVAHDSPPGAAAPGPASPGEHGEAGAGHGSTGPATAPPTAATKRGLSIPGAAHAATPPGRKAGAAPHGDAAEPHH
jgi:carbonic anhydrase